LDTNRQTNKQTDKPNLYIDGTDEKLKAGQYRYTWLTVDYEKNYNRSETQGLSFF